MHSFQIIHNLYEDVSRYELGLKITYSTSLSDTKLAVFYYGLRQEIFIKLFTISLFVLYILSWLSHKLWKSMVYMRTKFWKYTTCIIFIFIKYEDKFLFDSNLLSFLWSGGNFVSWWDSDYKSKRCHQLSCRWHHLSSLG